MVQNSETAKAIILNFGDFYYIDVSKFWRFSVNDSSFHVAMVTNFFNNRLIESAEKHTNASFFVFKPI